MATDNFQKYVQLAKQAIFDKQLAPQLAKMMQTTQGAVIAVKTVLGAMQQGAQVPAEIGVRLAPVIYLLIVDMLKDATNQRPDPAVMRKVMAMVTQAVTVAYKKASSQTQPQQQPQGIIAQAQGVPA